LLLWIMGFFLVYIYRDEMEIELGNLEI